MLRKAEGISLDVPNPNQMLVKLSWEQMIISQGSYFAKKNEALFFKGKEKMIHIGSKERFEQDKSSVNAGFATKAEECNDQN